MRNSSLKRSGMARVNEGSHSFTCHLGDDDEKAKLSSVHNDKCRSSAATFTVQGTTEQHVLMKKSQTSPNTSGQNSGHIISLRHMHVFINSC